MKRKAMNDRRCKSRRVGTEIYRAAYGDADYRVAVAMGNLASVYSAQKRCAECEHILREVVERLTKVLGTLNINTGISQRTPDSSA